MDESALEQVRSALHRVRGLQGNAREEFLEELERRDPLLHDAVLTLLRFDPPATRSSSSEPTPMRTTTPDVGPRYTLRGLLGRGGMGEVWEVLDNELHRPLALKVMRRELSHSGPTRKRFRAEGQTQAQLQHPNIVPIHTLSTLEDGRAYLTMPKVQGRTLSSVIGEVHRASVDAWRTAPSGWSLRRLVATFAQVCHAVAYAHGRGVIHRDLKPHNVMIGPYGEALLMDWGLAKRLGPASAAHGAGPAVVSDAEHQTVAGHAPGTPAYMAPEWVDRGEGALTPDEGIRLDVYALGGMLFCILADRPPYVGPSPEEVLEQVRQGPPLWPPQRADGPAAPADLVEICGRAMARDARARFASASELALALRDWLEGSNARERALRVVAEAEAEHREAERLRREAAVLRAEAEAWLREVAPAGGEDAKAPGWAKADEAARHRRQADLHDVAYRETLMAALNHAPDLEQAHQRLAQLHLEHHRRAEARRDLAEASEREALIVRHDRAGIHAAYLEGTGALTLVTSPPGARVRLSRYVERHRRLVEAAPVDLGVTPLHAVPLAMGRYLCRLQLEGHVEVRYPIWIERQQHWDGVAPGGETPVPIVLPPHGALGPDEVGVAAGWFWAGGDATAYQSLPRQRVWVDGFVIQRFPIVAEPTSQGLPRVHVSWHEAMGLAEVWRQRTGQGWRLPTELQWEKAARGVDGRYFPWGDHFDPTWCNVHDSAEVPGLAPVDAFEVDESPYGVRGMAGNVRDWCVDGGELRIVRGGAWNAPDPRLARAAYRTTRPAHTRQPRVGVRLVRPWGLEP